MKIKSILSGIFLVTFLFIGTTFGQIQQSGGTSGSGGGGGAVTIADGAAVTIGSKADAKSTATGTTSITIMQVLKQISASVQAPPSQAVTNAGTFAVQAAATIADGSDTTLGAKADAKSTSTDTTPISIVSILKQISASVQAPPTQAVTNAGTFAVQSTLQTGSAVVGYVREVAPNICGTTEYDSGWTLVPNTSTSVTATATCVKSVLVNNIDTATHTFTITDNSTACGGGICTILGPAFVIPALSQMRVPLEGAKMLGGVKWSADDATHLVATVRGNQ